MASNAEVFRAFAQGREAFGHNVRSVGISRGVALYSYSTPIAIKLAGADAIFDGRNYSVTTGTQRGQAMRLCTGATRIPHEEFRKMCRQYQVSLWGAR